MMKKVYVAPCAEVLEMEVAHGILQGSSPAPVEDFIGVSDDDISSDFGWAGW